MGEPVEGIDVEPLLLQAASSAAAAAAAKIREVLSTKETSTL
jgi:hypothetical protein